MKTVIFRDFCGNLKTTPEENYNARIQNARKINDCSAFSTPEEIIDYFCKWFGSKKDEFIVID